MSELLLDSLEIKGYRCFEHLTIEKLGRVNLIVGKNSVGKTALLEIISIYSNIGELRYVVDTLYSRDEIPYLPDQFGNVLLTPFIENFKAISFDNKSQSKNNLLFSICVNRKHQLSTYIGRLFDEGLNPTDLGKNLLDLMPEFPRIKEIVLMTQVDDATLTSQKPSFSFANLEKPNSLLNLNKESVNSNFRRFNGIPTTGIHTMWEEIVKKNFEDKVINALQILFETIQGMSFVGMPSGSQNFIPIIKIKDRKDKIPLRTLGAGLIKLLEIILSIVESENGVCLIDEIESGFHYSVLPDVWKLIFKTAKDLNVQVFATTHSKDCIEAFTQAAIDDEESEGMLIRLERQGEKIIAKTISEERLAQAINYEVEVR
jgi:AAA15 family ATPase/GTPase